MRLICFRGSIKNIGIQMGIEMQWQYLLFFMYVSVDVSIEI